MVGDRLSKGDRKMTQVTCPHACSGPDREVLLPQIDELVQVQALLEVDSLTPARESIQIEASSLS